MKAHRLSVLACVGCLSPAFAATIVVDPSGGGDFAEIQPAVDAAESGDVVLVRAGEYIISAAIVVPSRPMTIRSEEGADWTILRVTDPPPSEFRADGFHFLVPAVGTRLEGFSITHARLGIRIDGDGEVQAESPTVSRCRVEGNVVGIDFSQVRPRFFDCEIRDNLSYGVVSGSAWPLFVRCSISGTVVRSFFLADAGEEMTMSPRPVRFSSSSGSSRSLEPQACTRTWMAFLPRPGASRRESSGRGPRGV